MMISVRGTGVILERCVFNEKALKGISEEEIQECLADKYQKARSWRSWSGFSCRNQKKRGIKSYVVKTLMPEGFGHEYPSDRAGIFLLDLDEFKNLPEHVKAIDVLAELEGGKIKSIGGGKEYYLLMEKAEGKHYFNDLVSFAAKRSDLMKLT